MKPGKTSCILHGVYGRVGQLLLTHVILETGAHWSGIPLILLNGGDENSNLQPWGCMGEMITSSYLNYLDGIQVEPRFIKCKGRHTGMVIDWSDGFSRYPQEHKPLSLIALDDSRFCLLPNNYFTVSDKHFTSLDKTEELKQYHRGDKIYYEL